MQSKLRGSAGGVLLGKGYYGKRDCGTAHADVYGDGRIDLSTTATPSVEVTGKTETAEHAPLSHSKASHAEAYYTLLIVNL